MKKTRLKDFETLHSLCKRRGYLFQSAEIYGGLSACWDYGPLGVELKKKIAQKWWNEMTRRDDIVGLDSSILSHPQVFKASGHIDAFTDPLCDCLQCKYRFRLEKLSSCPKCGSEKITSPRPFNLMFKTKSGSLEDQSADIYLRPETAQGIYINFLNIQNTIRKKLPFGVAQIGKAFRNEITSGPFIFRTREFEQMEMQYFIPPKTNNKWYSYWKEQRLYFYEKIGLKNIRLHDHSTDELAHYAHKALDIEYHFPIGWQELEGIHDRQDYDLLQHQKESGKKLEYFYEDQKFIPHIIETSVGLDRLFLALLCENYQQENLEKEQRVVLTLPKKLAPITLAFLPLSKKQDLIELAQSLRNNFCSKYTVDYDEAGSIGKRYRRQDEIGTPFSITIDFESIKDHQVTVRDRDTMKQDRIAVSNLDEYLFSSLSQ